MNTQTHQTAVITGISSGIGLALTKHLLAQNYKVVGTTRTGHLDGFVHQNLKVIPLDVTSEKQRLSAAKAISNELSNVDLLINNAGIAPDVFQERPDFDSFTQTIATNLTAPIFFSELLIEQMNENGKIIFISSDMGLPKNAGANGAAYRVSKAGINMYAEVLGKSLTAKKIAVAALHPGWVKTKLGGDSAPLTPEIAAASIFAQLKVIQGTGKFYNAAAASIEAY